MHAIIDGRSEQVLYQPIRKHAPVIFVKGAGGEGLCPSSHGFLEKATRKTFSAKIWQNMLNLLLPILKGVKCECL